MTIKNQEVTYEIWMSDQEGQRIELLDNIISFNIVRVANNVGYGTFVLPGSINPFILGLDYLIEVWRAPIGSDLVLENVFFSRYFKFHDNQDGEEIITVSGPDGSDLFNRRIIAYAAKTSQAYKNTGDVVDVILDVINENLAGAAADSERSLVNNGFEVSPDPTSAGITITGTGFAWKPLLKVLQDFVNFAIGSSIRKFVYFTIAPISIAGGKISFIALVRPDQLGHDRTYQDGNPVVFGKEWGNLLNPELVYDYTKEINYIYGGGGGEESDRIITGTFDAGRRYASIWNRREKFIDARNSDDADIAGKNQEALRAGEPIVRFTATLLDTEQFRYGRDWFFGDRVVVIYQGRQIDCVVNAVDITIDAAGVEKISAKVESLLTSISPGQAEDIA